MMQNALKADSLERMVAIQSLYLNNVAQILTGNVSIDSIREIDSLARTDASYDIPRGEQEEARAVDPGQKGEERTAQGKKAGALVPRRSR